MMINKLLTGLAISLFSISLSAETTLRYSETGPNRGTRAQAIEYFMKNATELSGGELKFDIHWGGALLDYKAAANGLSVGTADIGSVLAVYEPTKLKALAIGDIPHQSADPWVGMRAMYELMNTNEDLERLLQKENLVYLTNFSSSGVQFECSGSNKIESIDDIKGKKIRAVAIYSKVLNDLGAEIASVTAGEIYQALDTGLVDCSASYLYTVRALKTFEVIDHLSLSDWGQVSGFAIVMNGDSWSYLSEPEQEALKEAGSNMIDYFARLQVEEMNGVVDGLTTGEIGNQVPVTRWSQDERQRLIDASASYTEDWIQLMNKSGVDGQKIWDQYMEIVARYEKEKDELGYPWER
ncbi:C4-dicarboxylate TRAP transporter substrate-binding protein [Marinobacter sp. 1-3A]|uniref:C4-dicarboxylate TRAP transporter substrate-binding protein n=1 Tax=Marinobacter sp. 1-3A TaxID=2582920 RepID=UPI001905D64F|nr:C4-dicarboxylate TRAP transporter substrate-binding protein [Marinobacter sp. 1-3A]MBK1875028.1 C4-dicarboxylate TRAP transporter substrate-binding protein [Marinobacter sp. 1-3A]